MRILHKNRSRIFFIAYLFAVSFLLLTQTGCNKDEECTIPRIDSITYRDSTYLVNFLVPGKIFTIHGENLDDPSAIYINKTPLNLLYTLTYESHITFLMPDLASSIAEEELSDSIRVNKTCGESLFRISILDAPPIIQNINNEYAIAGDTLNLTGEYFTLLQSILFPGEIEGEILSGYSDTNCLVIVPDGVTGSGDIVLTSKSGSGSTAYGIVFRDESGLLCNFDDLDTWEGFGGSVITGDDDPAIPLTNGKFFLGEAENISIGSEGVETTVLPLDFEQNFSYPGHLTPNYFAIKMEIFAKYPWSAGAYRIELGQRNSSTDIVYAYEYDYKAWNDSTINYVFSTPRWETVSVPLSGFVLKGTTDNYLQSYSQLRAINYMSWKFVNPVSDDEEGEVIDHVGIAIDNIRLKQIKEED